jgi:hypothetical protein
MLTTESCIRVSDGLCARNDFRWAADRPAGHARGLRRGDGFLESCFRGVPDYLQRARLVSDANWIADSRDLSDLRRWRRLVVVGIDPVRVFCKCRTEVGDVDLRRARCADCGRLSPVRLVAGNATDRTSRDGSPGIVSEPYLL